MEMKELFRVSDPINFRDILKCLSAINEDVTLSLQPEGVSVIMMDPSHVAMVELDLPKEYFDQYNITEADKISFNVTEALKALGKLGKDDYYLDLFYGFDEEKDVSGLLLKKINEKLSFHLKSNITREKQIRGLEPTDEEVPKPKIYFDSEVRMISSVLKQILDDFKDDCQHFKVKADYEGITFNYESDVTTGRVSLKRGDESILSHKVNYESIATFTFSYIYDIVKEAVKASEVIGLSLKTDMPLKLDCELPQGRLVYHVAPCIGV